MSDKYKIDNPEGIYFLTLTVVDWIDVFTRKEHKLTIVESLAYCQKHKGLILYAYCLMSNHLHLIVAAEEGFLLSDILRDFKRHTARMILLALETESESRRDWMLHRFGRAGLAKQNNRHYKFWQDGNQAKELVTNHFMEQKLDYIHQNPVEAMIVGQAEDYLFSSAGNYAGWKDNLLEVDFIA
ncbi:MAG: transposase [Bacteroidota bacterium]